VPPLGMTAAKADVEYFPYTYGWFTPGKGELEFGIKHTEPTSAARWQDSYEIEYGVTDRYAIEGYVVFNKSGGFRDFTTTSAGDADDGGGGASSGSGSAIFDPVAVGEAYRSGGFQIEQRYRFGDYALRKSLYAGYLEYAQLRGGPPTVTGKAIVQYDASDASTFALNLIATEPTRNGTTNWGYSFAGAYKPPKARLWGGGEAFGSWSSNNHYLGPTVGAFLGDRVTLSATYGKQIRGGGGDQVRVMTSYEFN
jgi:hypothetical protein